ncbi:hypothetical protein [Companilactobacillus bobalius]|uniref:Uncharacterized protein n=1 Tax=Companilactobacillus bobalius TaxID=2801451 RepID=A0A202F9C0_9LACO|nr:hypothetical protein [Companilactobacillus bobalius]OVE97023.1 hypothetical protein LKACC16343_02033 [Companilactobacillus bobalius]GEO59450.1 hypothetical protein LBO01_25790 [Companilactobacillus paralimentarius]
MKENVEYTASTIEDAEAAMNEAKSFENDRRWVITTMIGLLMTLKD